MATQLVDKELTCVECHTTFRFSVRDQQYYKEKKFTEPKRCRPCRDNRKARINGGPQDETDRVEVTVNCAQCGEETTVPFMPTKGRPVYCRPCYLEQPSSK